MELLKKVWQRISGRRDTKKTVVEEKKPTSEKEAHWDMIVSGKCPNCLSEDQLTLGARGGLSINVRCSKCKAVYSISRIRDFGADRVG
jgi:hypothetical protein